MSASIQPRTPSFRFSTRAFTLVETALALLAISLGLLGIFGLARHGIKNGGDTENETRCALLADTVFETLKAKNGGLAAEKYSLEEWQRFWEDFAQKPTSYVCYLPPMPDVTAQDSYLKLMYGTHNLQDQLPVAEPEKWNPQYQLTFFPDSDAQFTVQLSIHPGHLQSGSEWRTYYTTLGYAGGLP